MTTMLIPLTLKYIRFLPMLPPKQTSRILGELTNAERKQPTSRRWWPSRSPAFSAREPDLTVETKMPLWLPPTSVMSRSRWSPNTVSSCTGFREEFILEKDDSDGRKGLHADTSVRTFDFTAKVHCERCVTGDSPLQGEFPEDAVDLLQVVRLHPLRLVGRRRGVDGGGAPLYLILCGGDARRQMTH